MSNLLEHIDFEITNSCNLKCVHCSAKAGSGEKPDLDKIKKFLREAKKLGLKRLGITGGEPFLFPNELSELIDFSFDELDCPVHIHSNGQLIKDNLDLIIKKSGKIENLTLTLLGNSSAHDKNTGVLGSYEILKSSAQALASVPVTVTIFIVPMSDNFEVLPEAITELHNVGMRRFRIMRLSPGGRAREKYETLKLNKSQSENFIKKLKLLETQLDLEFEAGFCTRILYPDIKPLKHHPYCTSGINRLHINSRGYVFSCTASSGIIELNVGNINNQELAEIWENSKALKNLRERFPAKECNVQNYHDKHSDIK